MLPAATFIFRLSKVAIQLKLISRVTYARPLDLSYVQLSMPTTTPTMVNPFLLLFDISPTPAK